MSIAYQILPDLDLVYVQYSGVAGVIETFASYTDYLADPDHRPGQKQLIDLSQVLGFEKNYASLLMLHAVKARALSPSPVETLMVYYAPSDRTFAMARLAAQSWSGVGNISPRIARSEAEALALLGRPETRLADLCWELRQPSQVLS